MSDDNPKPIKPYHVDFAQEVVRLARKHGVGSVKMQFSRTSSRMFRQDDGAGWDSTEVDLVWLEGRHGSTEPIKLQMSARASASFSELEPQS